MAFEGLRNKMRALFKGPNGKNMLMFSLTWTLCGMLSPCDGYAGFF